MDAIYTQGISKSYGKAKALDNVSLSVSEGEIFGLIGPDGAGKTSLFRILTTLMLADSGQAKVCGLDVVKDYMKIRRITGYMPGRFSLYQDLTVEENLNFFATLFGTTVRDNYDNIREIYSQIEPFRDRKAGKLSGGMKQKLALSCALVHRPQVLFLDEPTTGVDAVSRKEFWQMLGRISASGVTIFVSTPYMDEASLCGRIALIKDGTVIDSGTPKEITSGFPYRLLRITGTQRHAMLAMLRKQPQTLSCFSFGDSLHLSVAREGMQAEQVAALLRDGGFGDAQAEEMAPGIEDRFMQLCTDRTER